MTNGGIIGPKNSSTAFSAQGVWGLKEQYAAIKNNLWPKPIISMEGLSFYLDAKLPNSYSGSGTVWNDLSGNGNNFSWASSPIYVSGSHPYFISGQIATGPASNSVGIDNTTGYTIQILANNRVLAESSAFKFYSSVSTGRGIYAHLTWSDNNVYFDQGGCCSVNQRVSVASGGSDSWNLWTFRRNAFSRDIWKNGTLLATRTDAPTNIDLISTNITLFGDNDFGTAWNAWVSSFIAYNRGISDAEIISNYNSIANLYGI